MTLFCLYFLLVVSPAFVTVCTPFTGCGVGGRIEEHTYNEWKEMLCGPPSAEDPRGGV